MVSFLFFFSNLFHIREKRAPVAQVVVHPVVSDFQAGGSGVRFLVRYQWKFSKYFNRGCGGSEPTLNCRSHHKEVSDLQGSGSIGANYLGGFWVIYDFIIGNLNVKCKLEHIFYLKLNRNKETCFLRVISKCSKFSVNGQSTSSSIFSNICSCSRQLLRSFKLFKTLLRSCETLP